METREQSIAAPEASNDQSSTLNPEAKVASEESVATAQPENPNPEIATESPQSENTPEDDIVERPVAVASKKDVIKALATLADNESADISRDEISRLKQQFYAFRKTELEQELDDFIAQGNDKATFVPALDPDEETFKELMTRIRDRKAAIAAALEAEMQQNFDRKQSLIEELTTLAADTDNVNLAFPRIKEIQAEFKAIGDVPPTEATTQWKSYQTAVEQFYDQLKINKDLRDYDFRKNLELKTILCEEAEKLNDEEDVILAFKRLQNHQSNIKDKDYRQALLLYLRLRG